MVSRILRRSGIAIVEIAELLDNWVPKLVIQVGVGTHHEEVAVMQEAWPGVAFIGFEAHPIIYGYLGDYPGQLINKAIAAEQGEVTMRHHRRHKDGTSIGTIGSRTDEPDDWEEITVPTTTLDAEIVLLGGNRNRLLWLDCEGSELEALKGGTELLERVDVVNIEMTSKPKLEGWPDPCVIHQWLVEQGFYRQWVHTQRPSAGQCDVIYVRRHLFKEQYCSCPCEVMRYRGECVPVNEDPEDFI